MTKKNLRRRRKKKKTSSPKEILLEAKLMSQLRLPVAEKKKKKMMKMWKSNTRATPSEAEPETFLRLLIAETTERTRRRVPSLSPTTPCSALG